MKIDGSTSQVINTSSPQKEGIHVKMPTIKEQQELQQKIQLEAQAQAQQEKDEQELSKEELGSILKGLNEFLKPTFTSLNFKLHEGLDKYYVEVVDQETKKVIREIPSKEMLDMYAKMTEFLGLFVDRKL